MPDLTYGELNQGIGSPTGDLANDFANNAADVFCNAFSNDPGAFIGGPVTSGPGFAALALASRICQPRDKMPTPPQPPFEGGQCDCILYRVSYQAYYSGSPSFNGQTRRYGPISGLSLGSTGDLKTIGFFYGSANCGGRQRYNIIANFEKYGMGEGENFAVITGVTRDDEQPDTCGNPAPEFPASMPPLNNLEGPTIVPILGVPTPLPFKIPPILPPVELPDFPLFIVNVGGIDVNFDLGGVNLNVNPTIQLPPTLPPPTQPPGYNLPPVSPTKPNTDTKPLSDKLDNIEDTLDDTKDGVNDANDKLDDLKDCDRCTPKFTYPVEFLPPQESRTSVGYSDELFAVTLTFDVAPANPKLEPGGNGPTVYYAGWFWFIVNGGTTERQPIDAYSKTYIAPERAAGFAYTCRKGYSVYTAVIKKLKVQESQ